MVTIDGFACRFRGGERQIWRTFELQAAYADRTSRLAAKGNLHAINSVDGRVPGRGAPQHCNPCIGDKAHVHQVILYGFRQFERQQNSRFSDL